MDTICRLCSKESSSLQSLFTFHKNRIISDIVKITCPVKIEFGDEYPQLACISCINIAYEALELRENSVRSYEYFQTKHFKQRINSKSTEDNEEMDLLDEIKEEIEDQQKYVSIGEFLSTEFSIQSDSNEGTSNYSNNPLIHSVSSQNTLKALFECYRCGEMFSYRNELNEHRARYHKNESKLECYLCKSIFSCYGTLKRHKKRFHDPNFPFECIKCNIRLKNVHLFISHNKRFHQAESEQKEAQLKKELLLADSTSNDASIQSESDCNDEDDDSTLNNVSKEQRRPQEEACSAFFKCRECGELFQSGQLLADHILKYHKNLAKLECVCKMKFASPDTLRKHKRRFHDINNPFKCSECDVRVKSQLLLKLHKRKAHLIGKYPDLKKKTMCNSEEDLICKLCEYKFTTRYSVQLHKMRAHNPSFAFKCEKCLKTFETDNKLVSHIDNVHKEFAVNSLHENQSEDDAYMDLEGNQRYGVEKPQTEHNNVEPIRELRCRKSTIDYNEEKLF